jgi:hypothetical protein
MLEALRISPSGTSFERGSFDVVYACTNIANARSDIADACLACKITLFSFHRYFLRRGGEWGLAYERKR